MEEQTLPVNLCIFEDARYPNFLPLVLNRPVFDLFIGTQTLAKRIVDELDPQTVSYVCRRYLSALVKAKSAQEESPHSDGETIFLNGRLLTYGAELIALLSALESGTMMHKKGVAVAAKLSGDEAAAFLEKISEPLSDEAVQKDIQSLKKRAAAESAGPKTARPMGRGKGDRASRDGEESTFLLLAAHRGEQCLHQGRFREEPDQGVGARFGAFQGCGCDQ